MSEGTADSGAPARQPKNIVICSDGTGNHGGKARGTNVWGIFRGLTRHVPGEAGAPGMDQIGIYGDGVGTQNFLPFRLLGGAFGMGVNKNVRQLYTELVHVFNDGDRIFLFGFSRGAHTVRMLAGFIIQQGVVKRSDFPTAHALDKEVRNRYEKFRARSLSNRPEWLLKPDASKGAKAPPAKQDVHFLGVWDTVGAVGGPFPFAADIINAFIGVTFKDRDLGKGVLRARHALAIDDERKTFHPTLWNKDADRIKQVWFPGVHTNVGGGYPKDQVAYVALDWMIQEAEEEVGGVRLYFNKEFKDAIRGEADECGKLYNSRAGLAAFYRYSPRPIEKLCRDRGEDVHIHESALRRAAAGTRHYAPAAVPADATVATNRERPAPTPSYGEVQTALANTDSVRHEKLAETHGVNRKRKILYWSLIGTLSLLVIGAILAKTSHEPTLTMQREGVDSLVMTGLGTILPEFVMRWIAPGITYAVAHPIASWIVIAVIALLFVLKSRLESRSNASARDAWKAFRDAYPLNPKSDEESEGDSASQATS